MNKSVAQLIRELQQIPNPEKVGIMVNERGTCESFFMRKTYPIQAESNVLCLDRNPDNFTSFVTI